MSKKEAPITFHLLPHNFVRSTALSLLPLPPSSWHRPGLHNHGFCHEGFLSSLSCGCCAGQKEKAVGMSYGSPAGGEGQVRIPRCRGWTALAPECSAGCLCSACSVQKQPVFFTATSLASPASSRHFLSEEKNNQGLIILFWGCAKLASICSIWTAGEKHQSWAGREREGTKL